MHRSDPPSLDLSHCTWSGYDRAGLLGIQADSFGGKATPWDHLSPLGLDARPADPDGDLGALCWRWLVGNQGHVFPLNDQRTEPALPNLNKGATRVFDTGTYKGHPFHFTATLDPVTNEIEIKSWREGGKYRYENAEGLKLEITGTNVKITGATSVELGGTTPLALGPAVDAMFTALKAAVAAATAAETGGSGMNGMKALNAALSAWPTSVAATITKGA